MAAMKIDISDVVNGAIEKIEHEGYMVQKWIPCETELPYGGKRVLVTTAEGNVVDAIFVLKGNQWFRNGEYFPTDRVIAWMPMPSAYEPEKEDADDS